MSSLDLHTGRYPEDDQRPQDIGKRVYRNIDAPKGCTLYWDQPALVAAHALSRLTGDDSYSNAADRYVCDFLDRCVAKNGMFLWGNHYYYDAFRDEVMRFHGDETPVPAKMASERGELHEIRPIPPAWALFWRVSSEMTEKAIRQLGRQHLFDAELGGFNRHADGKRSYAFLEAGGILAETLAWLAARTGDRYLADTARRIIEFSWLYRYSDTNLVENSPTKDRWDKYVCTTEVGLWAGCALRAAELGQISVLNEIAAAAVSAYLDYGYDADAQRYYGKLKVRDGRPSLGPKSTRYEPGDYADIWNALFPTHDYPLALAESCLTLYTRTRKVRYQQAVARWVNIVRDALSTGQGYAEHYGRCIHFLCRAAHVFDESSWLSLAEQAAEKAIDLLFVDGMFRGHPGEDRYDAVDGVGYLMLALLYLDTGQEPDGMGFFF
jgi:hypothetical protein